MNSTADGASSKKQSSSKKAARPNRRQVAKKNAAVIEAYDKYHRGLLTRNSLFMILWPILERQVGGMIRNYHRALNLEMNDLMQIAKLQVLEHLDDYDPEQSLPGSYFIYFINEAHRKECGGEISRYYLTTVTALSNVAKENGYEGIEDDRLSDVELAALSGQSIQTVRNARYMNNIYHARPFEAVEDTVEDIFHETPEEKAVKAERRAEGLKAFENLSDFEKILYYNVKVNLKSLKGLVSVLKKGDRYLAFGFDHLPSVDELSCILNTCQRKLEGSRYVAENSHRKTVDETAGVEQVTEEELNRLFDSGSFDDI